MEIIERRKTERRSGIDRRKASRGATEQRTRQRRIWKGVPRFGLN